MEAKNPDIQFPETLTVRETMGEETTERTLSGITWKLDAENSDYSEFQGGLAPEDYFDRFDEDGEPEETEEKTWKATIKPMKNTRGDLYLYSGDSGKRRDTGRHCFAGDPCAGGRRGDCAVCG